MPLTGPASEGQLRVERARKSAAVTVGTRWREGEEGKKGKERDIQLHIHRAPLPLLITLQSGGGWKFKNTLAH